MLIIVIRGLIVFLGPVGVGKSTTIRVLSTVFSAKGIKVRVVFIKSFHGLSYLLWFFVSWFLSIPRGYAPWFLIPKLGYTRIGRILTVTSLYVDLLINIPIRLLLILLDRLFKFVTFSEEYIYSTLFDYIYSYSSLNIKSPLERLPLKVLLAIAVKYQPEYIIVLDAKINRIFERWSVRGYGDPQLKYALCLRWFLHRYLRILASNSKIVVVDTTNLNIADTVKAVIKAIGDLRHLTR